MDTRDDEDCLHLSSRNLKRRTSPEPIDLDATNDRISILPEDILIPIISLLTLREAAQISILSRSWRFLWMKTVNLDFDTKNMTGKDEREHYQDSSIALENKRLKFAAWVSQMLNIHDGPKIDSCRVTYDLGTDFAKEFGQWIQILASKQVEKLNINFSDSNRSHTFRIHSVFPLASLFLPHQEDQENAHLKHLTLNTCALMPKTVCGGLRNFLSLSLYSTAFGQEIMDNIIHSCVFLESLSITHCYTSSVFLKIGSDNCSLMNLTHLNISFCSDLIFVLVSGAPKLSSLEQRGERLMRIQFVNTATHVKLCLDPPKERARLDQVFHDLSTGYYQYEVLLLYLNIQQGYKKPRQLPEFAKLREIVLMIQGPYHGDFSRIIAWFIKASPFLQKLELHLPGSDKDEDTSNNILPQNFRQLKNKRNSRHGVPRGGNLKLLNFSGEINHLQVALFLLKHIDALETMIIDRRGKIYGG